MMTMRLSMVLLGVAALAAVACGSDSDDEEGSSGQVSTTIPKATQGGQLTQAQAEELCAAAAEASLATLGSSDVKAKMCGFSAYLTVSVFSEAVGSCQKLYDDCAKAPAKTTTGTCEKPSPACTATVGEIEACWTDVLAQSTKALDQLPGCADVGKEVPMDSDGAGQEPPTPASCAIVQQKCPEALDDAPSLPSTESSLPDDSAGPSDSSPNR